MFKQITTRFLFIIVIMNGLLFVVHTFIISQSLSDGTHINPNINLSPWQPKGVMITVLDSRQNELRDGDIVLTINGHPLSAWVDELFCLTSSCSKIAKPDLRQGTQLTYTILRAGHRETAVARLRPYPFWEVVRRSWGGLTFAAVSYLIFTALFFKRPKEDSVIALALAASGLFGSMGWAFGLDTVAILSGSAFWLYRFATEVVYWLSVIGILHFALVFPKPLPFIQRQRWILPLLYPAVFLLYISILALHSQTTANRLLWLAYIFSAQSIVVSLCYGLALISLLVNYQKLTQDSERQQIRIVFVTSALIILLSISARALPTALFGEGLITSNEMAILALIVPIAIVFSILRHRLWDIDIIINRTLVFTSASATIVALYIVLVAGIGRVLQTETNLPTSIVATGIVAVMFQPIRLRLQNLVNRAMYGERDDPAAVLTQLAQQLETAKAPAAILPNLVQTIAHTLKIPHVAIWLPSAEKQFEPLASWGKAPDHVEMIPLTYQTEMIGHLIVAPRGPQESFNRQEKQLLHTIASLTANTVRAVQLSNELRRSRQRIVTAREEERRRLRRDLHDGLGPQLASQTLGIEAVKQLLSINPQKARQLLDSLEMQAQEAITDIRRLVYDLRPPTLDDLGLIEAIKQGATHYESEKLQFAFEVPQPLPELPAAVETAVYRITQEAMTNIVRHAQASQAAVRLTYDKQHLKVEISDNGQGLPNRYQSGVGLQSMQERAAELNGRCIIEKRPEGGTIVKTWLPLEENNE